MTARSYRHDDNTPMVSELAEIIASGLFVDIKEGRLQKIGIDDVRAAINSREQTKTLGWLQLGQLEGLTLRKLINKTM